tara:strand:+ start:6184 stop:7326 length:1143 start_codon:yes stop_codon:yes gene_type:complete
MKIHELNATEVAQEKLSDFIKDDLKNYAKLRNYDYGPNKRNNVSNLSQFISHRAINEYFVIKEVLKSYSLDESEKYIQEIFWRIYWKGWLEHHPAVWSDFTNYKFTDESLDLISAKEGKTNITCFNSWVEELKEFNYLHNHSRMWFASIWIFTLGLPWQEGAKFFLEHLKDGDAASNTLGWRWVAGLQTKGKNYLAKSWNISKFTNDRFNDKNLNEDAEPLIETTHYEVKNLNFLHNSKKVYNNLLIFDNELSLLTNQKLFKDYENISIVSLENKNRKIPLSPNIINFKEELIFSYKGNTNDFKILSSEDLIKEEIAIKKYDVVYPCIGENLDFLNGLTNTKKVELNIRARKQDLYAWQYTKKGFFYLKNNINNVIEYIL